MQGICETIHIYKQNTCSIFGSLNKTYMCTNKHILASLLYANVSNMCICVSVIRTYAWHIYACTYTWYIHISTNTHTTHTHIVVTACKHVYISLHAYILADTGSHAHKHIKHKQDEHTYKQRSFMHAPALHTLRNAPYPFACRFLIQDDTRIHAYMHTCIPPHMCLMSVCTSICVRMHMHTKCMNKHTHTHTSKAKGYMTGIHQWRVRAAWWEWCAKRSQNTHLGRTFVFVWGHARASVATSTTLPPTCSISIPPHMRSHAWL